MSTTLRFSEHTQFQHTALAMTAAGACAGVAAQVVAGLPMAWALALVVGAGAAAAIVAKRRARPTSLALAIGVVVVAAAAAVLWHHQPMSASGVSISVLSAGALAFGAALAWGLKGWRWALAIAFGAAVAGLGMRVGLGFLDAQVLTSAPAWLASVIAGGALGCVSVFALLPRHVSLERDPVALAHRQLPAGLSGEAKTLVERGQTLWIQTAPPWPGTAVERAALGKAVLRLFAVAERWQAVEDAGCETTAAALRERIDSLTARIEHSRDELTRAQYQAAAQALSEQLHDLDEIDLGRQRTLAQMHRYAASMERLHLAAIRRASADAATSAASAEPLMTELSELGQALDASAEALVEAERLLAG